MADLTRVKNNNANNLSSALWIISLLVSLILLSACNSSSNTTNTQTNTNTIVSTDAPVLSELDQQVLTLAQQLQLTGDPSTNREYLPISDSLAQLGKQLFFQPFTINHSTFSCAQCHDPLSAGTSRTALATGLPKPTVPLPISDYLFHRGRTLLPVRNATSTFNSVLWDQVLFHDGRVQALQPTKNGNGNQGGITTPYVPLDKVDSTAGRNLVQAASQVSVLRRSEFTKNHNPDEPLPSMCVINIDEQVNRSEQRFSPVPNLWLNRFRKGFNTPDGLPITLLTHEKTAEALATYMRSQVFINNPWKQYLEGNTSAISETAKQGALLFFRSSQQGGFGCVSCHVGDHFTDEKFHRTLMPPITLQRPFRAMPEEADYGRWFITHNEDDKFLFRTPSLLNVSETGPWGHNGAYSTLSGVVRHMLDPANEASRYDVSGLSVEGLAADHLGESLNQMLLYGVDIPSQSYSQKDLQALVAFLYTLTDPCIKEPVCLKPWLPDNIVLPATKPTLPIN